MGTGVGAGVGAAGASAGGSGATGDRTDGAGDGGGAKGAGVLAGGAAVAGAAGTGGGDAGRSGERGALLGTEVGPLPPPWNTNCTEGGGSQCGAPTRWRASSRIANSNPRCSRAESAADGPILRRSGRRDGGRSIINPAEATSHRHSGQSVRAAAYARLPCRATPR